MVISQTTIKLILQKKFDSHFLDGVDVVFHIAAKAGIDGLLKNIIMLILLLLKIFYMHVKKEVLNILFILVPQVLSSQKMQ